LWSGGEKAALVDFVVEEEEKVEKQGVWRGGEEEDDGNDDAEDGAAEKGGEEEVFIIQVGSGREPEERYEKRKEKRGIGTIWRRDMR